MATPQTSDKAERVWHAVLEYLSADSDAHDGCDAYAPDQCTLYRAIADAMGGEE